MEIYYMDDCKTSRGVTQISEVKICHDKEKTKHNTYADNKKHLLAVIFILTHIF